jgi:shikimate kinase
MTRAGHIVIVGLMGSGKTTLGRALAERLGRPFVDGDAALEARHGQTAREIADRDGLARLHVLEAEVLKDALATEAPAVHAAAASTVEDLDVRRALAAPGTATVWLRGAPAVLAERALTGAHRPLVSADPLTVLSEQSERRGPLFEQVADVIVDVDGRSPREVLAATLAALRHPAIEA